MTKLTECLTGEGYPKKRTTPIPTVYCENMESFQYWRGKDVIIEVPWSLAEEAGCFQEEAISLSDVLENLNYNNYYR